MRKTTISLQLRSPLHWLALIFLGGLIIVAGLIVGVKLAEMYIPDQHVTALREKFLPSVDPLDMPTSVMPGPPRDAHKKFKLSAESARHMKGVDVAKTERWSDIAGNYYTRNFVQNFSYENTSPEGPQVLVRTQQSGETFRGRLEAKNLKPNFAYQLKLRGDPEHFEDFEKIGYKGRWRLPGGGTNFSDEEYENCGNKKAATAYILFDYFMTDAAGNAIRKFSLDSSLHVLWNATRQRDPNIPEKHLLDVKVDASDPEVYVRPKTEDSLEQLWAEREQERYSHADQKIRLPPGTYHATLVLTEASFHSAANDGGNWATVFELPVTFKIVE